MALLELEEVVAAYGNIQALKGLSLASRKARLSPCWAQTELARARPYG